MELQNGFFPLDGQPIATENQAACAAQHMVSCNGQFPVRDSSVGHHGSCIHQNKYPVQDDEYNYRDSR